MSSCPDLPGNPGLDHRLIVGDRVYHKVLGEGEVIAGDHIVDVRFGDGMKRLLANDGSTMVIQAGAERLRLERADAEKRTQEVIEATAKREQEAAM